MKQQNSTDRIVVRIHWKDGSNHMSDLAIGSLKKKTYTAVLHDGSTMVVSYEN